jgi:cytochrome c peroxidase
MFSDFREHVIGVPHIAPEVGNPTAGNVIFDGLGHDEDFGLEQITGNPNDRYMFRTSPIRNVGLQPSFFHNGAFTRLEDAIRFHLDPAGQAAIYNPTVAGVAVDLRGPTGPIAPVLARLDPLMQTPHVLSSDEFRQLVDFVRNGLLDPQAKPDRLRKLIPANVPSGRALQVFQ